VIKQSNMNMNSRTLSNPAWLERKTRQRKREKQQD
jgi:hypothetical protein